MRGYSNFGHSKKLGPDDVLRKKVLIGLGAFVLIFFLLDLNRFAFELLLSGFIAHCPAPLALPTEYPGVLTFPSRFSNLKKEFHLCTKTM